MQQQFNMWWRELVEMTSSFMQPAGGNGGGAQQVPPVCAKKRLNQPNQV
jgi:hypothetical protein